jgi:fibronectin type 3 domain-containing protein
MLYQGVVVRRKFAVQAVLLVTVFLKSFTAFAANVTLAWDASPDPSVTGYRVYYGGASGVYTNSLQVGNVTTATVSNLVLGATYYFAATARDNAGTESDFSNETSFTPVPPPNQPPTLNALVNVTINEGAGLQTVNLSGISSGSATEVQTLTVTATSSHPGLIPHPTVNYTSPNTTGSIGFTPVAFGFGTATITVTVNDGGASNNIVTRTFTVTVNPVNNVPTLNALANVTINEGAGLQTVNLSGISSGATNEVQTLVVTATSSNPGLIPHPTVTYTSPNATGSLGFTPVPFGFGSATVTVTVNDGGTSNNIVTRTFTVTVNPVNDAPTLNALANLTINEGAGLQTVNLAGITTGATNEIQTLTVTATSSNPSLIPNPTVNYTSPNPTGTLSFTPAANSGGTATITVTVNDGAAANNTVTRTFTVTVNRLPVISAIPDLTNTVGTTIAPIAFTVSDTETSASSLVVTASSDNPDLVAAPGLVVSGTGGNRTLTITPIASATGTAEITLTVNDGQGSAHRTFQLTIKPRPLAPANLGSWGVSTSNNGRASGP